MERDKRAHARVPARVKVTFERGGATTEARSRDLSLGGMFLEGEHALSFGDELQLTLHLPALSAPVTVRATVRWVKPDGVGLAFGALRAAETWAINALLAEHPR